MRSSATWHRGIRGQTAARHRSDREITPRRTTGCLAVLAVMVLAGCNDAQMRLTPIEKADLERRALDLLHRAAESDIDVLRCNAIEALVELNGPRSIAMYRAALKSDAAMVRFAGLVALGDIRDRDSLNDMMAALRDPHPLVRLAAAFACYRCGDTEQGRALLSALKDSPDERVRAEAAHLIGKLGEPKARSALRAAMRDKTNLVAVQASAALAQLGESEGVDRLIEYAYGELNSRMLALQGLAQRPDERARDTLQYIVEKRDDYLQARLVAARGLGGLGASTGFEIALQSLRYSDRDVNEQARVRVLAATALGAIGDERALPALRDAAENNDDERVQVAASYAIVRIIRKADAAPSPAPRS